jgi:uroporphyrinogen-III synthase
MSDLLRNKRVLVTRAKNQNEKFKKQLIKVGAIPIEFPTIQIIPPSDTGPLDNAIAGLATYDWLIFTSANGVKHFWQRLAAAGKGLADLQLIHIAAIGPATAASLTRYGLTVDLTPSEYVAEALLEAIGDVAGQRILLPSADIARLTLAEGLAAKGATVERVTAYQTKPVEDPGNLPVLLPTLDILTFTSASTVRNFVYLLRSDHPATAIGQATVACIGPVTAQTAQELGLPIHVVAEEYTISGLVEALIKYFKDKTHGNDATAKNWPQKNVDQKKIQEA